MPNPQITITIPSSFISSLNQFMTNVQKFQVQAQNVYSSTPQVQFTKLHAAQNIVLNKVRDIAKLFAKLSGIMQRQFDRIFNFLGTFGKSFLKAIPWERLALMLGPAGAVLSGMVFTAKIAAGFVSGGFLLGKWLWDRMVGFGDSMLRDWLISSGTVSTIGGVRAFRTTFLGLPEDPNILPNVMRSRFNRSTQQFMAMQVLGIQNLSNTADMAVEAAVAAQRFMKAQQRGTALFLAEKFGLTALFDPKFLVALQTMTEEELRERVKLYEHRKSMFEISQKAVEAWKNFRIQISAAGVQITNIIAEKLADKNSGFTKAFEELSKAIVKALKVFLDITLKKETIDTIIHYMNLFSGWMKSEGPTLKIKEIKIEVNEILKALEKAKKAVESFGQLFGVTPPPKTEAPKTEVEEPLLTPRAPRTRFPTTVSPPLTLPPRDTTTGPRAVSRVPSERAPETKITPPGARAPITTRKVPARPIPPATTTTPPPTPAPPPGGFVPGPLPEVTPPRPVTPAPNPSNVPLPSFRRQPLRPGVWTRHDRRELPPDYTGAPYAYNPSSAPSNIPLPPRRPSYDRPIPTEPAPAPTLGRVDVRPPIPTAGVRGLPGGPSGWAVPAPGGRVDIRPPVTTAGVQGLPGGPAGERVRPPQFDIRPPVPTAGVQGLQGGPSGLAAFKPPFRVPGVQPSFPTRSPTAQFPAPPRPPYTAQRQLVEPGPGVPRGDVTRGPLPPAINVDPRTRQPVFPGAPRGVVTREGLPTIGEVAVRGDPRTAGVPGAPGGPSGWAVLAPGGRVDIRPPVTTAGVPGLPGGPSGPLPPVQPTITRGPSGPGFPKGEVTRGPLPPVAPPRPIPIARGIPGVIPGATVLPNLGNVRQAPTSLFPANLDPKVREGIERIAKEQGVSPEAIAGVVKTESQWNPNNTTKSYHGLFQLDASEGYRPGWTPTEQVEAYGDMLRNKDFAGKVNRAGIDLSKESPARQAAILQGFQFSPNASQWMTDFSTPSSPMVRGKRATQARALGDTSVNSMTGHFNREMGSAPTTTDGIPETSRSKDYFQRQGANPATPGFQSNLQTVNTDYGPIKVHKDAAADWSGFYKDLHNAGAPLEVGEQQGGSYNLRRMRHGNAWSSHSYGASVDLDNKAYDMPPKMQSWIEANRAKWIEIKNKWNIHQPYTRDSKRDASELYGEPTPRTNLWDVNHLEWYGPHGSHFDEGGNPVSGKGSAIAAKVTSQKTKPVDPSVIDPNISKDMLDPNITPTQTWRDKKDATVRQEDRDLSGFLGRDPMNPYSGLSTPPSIPPKPTGPDVQGFRTRPATEEELNKSLAGMLERKVSPQGIMQSGTHKETFRNKAGAKITRTVPTMVSSTTPIQSDRFQKTLPGDPFKNYKNVQNLKVNNHATDHDLLFDKRPVASHDNSPSPSSEGTSSTENTAEDHPAELDS